MQSGLKVPPMSPTEIDERLARAIDVSRETLDRLQIYHDRALWWNRRINLISREDEKHFWARHILDAAGVLSHFAASEAVVDIGSGNGVPGLVLAIFFDGAPQAPRVSLCEPDKRKAAFLSEVVRELGLGVTVLSCRVHDLRDHSPADIVSRGFLKLPMLLELRRSGKSWMQRQILMKSKAGLREIEAGVRQASWSYRVYQNSLVEFSFTLIVAPPASIDG